MGLRRRAGFRRFLENQPMPADRDHVCVMKLVPCNRAAINGGSVGAHQVFEKEDGLNLYDSRMMPRDGGILNHEGVVGFPANRQCLVGQFKRFRDPCP